jgi:hypothetical protein
VDDVLAGYFGDLPSRALLAGRIEAALALADEKSGYRLVERMAEVLRGHAAEPAERCDIPVPEPDLREHVHRLHPPSAAGSLRMTMAQLADWHANEHFRYGSRTHHHGPNAGPHARPAGWRDGSGVVLDERQP